ncbi:MULTISPECIES: hypothetical protein [unclassified Leucobacter]|uniref:hypothetical protein n=1 Tax=unclassified Leucobacter TaxID=2621730 RepID=UPI000621D61A|nr:hypothetical protein [Leucobacter sp. Ag1]KKI20550.1 hypothetical protein XM48_07455 [Leucobacter sp. Ag1]
MTEITMTNERFVFSGPWTSHGHAIPGVTKGTAAPKSRARCGGPSICETCSTEAAQAQRVREERKDAPKLATTFEQKPGEYLTVDGEKFPWYIHEDGCRIEPIDASGDLTVLWVPILIDTPCPQMGKPVARLVGKGLREQL